MPNSRKLEKILSPLHISCSFILYTLLVTMFFLSTAARAEDWYVKPSAEVPIRSGQGTEFKILSVVPDGLMVEIVEESDPWVKVRTPGGTEGWMLKRYLSNDPPLSEMVDSLQSDNEKLAQLEEETSRKYDELLTAYTQMEQEYNACLADRDDLRNKYQALRNDTADVIKIKQNLSQATEEVEQIRQKMAEVEEQNRKLEKNMAIRWFMAGGLVLVLGWLIGLVTGRSRKRKSSLY